MDWTNERYVRVFTRDTVGTLCLSWEARCLFWELLRKVDRAGVLDCGGHEPAKALAVSLRIPLEVATRVLPEWEADGRAIVRDGSVVIPCHLAAQEATQSDRARARAARERRSIGVTNCDATVTKRDAAVTNCDATVTPGHAPSRAVTPRHSSQTSQTSQTDPNKREPRKRGPVKVLRPDGWAPDDRCRAFAQEWNLDLALEAQSFIAWTDAGAYRYADWQAAFRNHLARARKHNDERDGDRRARYEAADHAERKAQPLPVLRQLFREPDEPLRRRPTPPKPPDPPKTERPAETEAERDARIEAERQRAVAALAAMAVSEVAQ